MITDEEEEIFDIQWFAIDANNSVAQFTTGGQGFIPFTSKKSLSDLKIVSSFVQDDLPSRCPTIMASKLASHIAEKDIFDIDTFKSFYNEMSSKGLYSFCPVRARGRPVDYFLVAKPARPIKLADFPMAIRELLEATRFSGDFETVDLVTLDRFLPTIP